jgi:hypothetical protein
MKLISDKYRKARGGHSRLLEISCEKCGCLVSKYQKDGPGNLRRMYIDRMLDAQLNTSKKELLCLRGHVLGIRIIYKKENRLAYRIFVDAVKKKIIKST